MAKSEQINEVAKALAKAQGEIAHAVKDSENPFHKSKYADLASVWEACRKQLSENELSVVQLPDGLEDNCLILETTLLHSSGQWISSRIKIPMQKQDPQGYGSTLTYARRYALAAMVGVYQDDDDAQSAQKQQNTPTNTNAPANTQKANTTQATKPHEQSIKITADKAKALIAKCTKEGITTNDLLKVIDWKYKVKKVEDLLIKDFAQIMNSLQIVWKEYVAYKSEMQHQDYLRSTTY